MQFNFEEIQSMFDNDTRSEKNVFNEICLNLYNEEQCYLNYHSSYDSNSTFIELDEKKKKENEQFLKSFKKVFSSEEKHNIDNDVIEERIYFIKKQERKNLRRKRGRLEKNALPLYELKHSKLSGDNLILKIIRNFINVCLNYINKTYEENIKEKKYEPLLRSIDPKIYNVYSNKKIYELFNKTLGEVFSSDISKRNSYFLSSHSKDYNKIAIKLLKNDNKQKNLVEILNLTMKEMYEKYLNNNLGEFNFENDLIQIEKKEGTEYKIAYEKKALKLIDIINEKGKKLKENNYL